ncbi:ABC transporter permease [Desulfococcaceae bacterium HSG7]|nr:ABC transporter permease [Desulfococcaceae bacterium HSG7]
MSDRVKSQLRTILTATRSLLRHKLRSGLSILGIVCGVMAVLAMISIGEGAREEVLRQIELLGTKNIILKTIQLTDEQHNISREKMSSGLNLYDIARIKKGCQSVKLITGSKDVTATIHALRKEISPQVVACLPNYAAVQNLSIINGRFIADQDVVFKNQVCVLGNSLSKRMGFEGNLGDFVRIDNFAYKVVGILGRYDRKSTKTSVVSVRDYNEIIFIPLGTEKGFYPEKLSQNNLTVSELDKIVVQVHESDQVISTSSIMERILEVSHNGMRDYQMVIPQELLRKSQATQKIFNIVLGVIAGISLLVGGIGVMNIMLATVSERTREIGIRRAVGATQHHIIVQFLTEAVILTFSGGVAGIAAGFLAVRLITAYAEWNTAITLWSVSVPLIMSILAGVFFGLYPAVKASRMDPIAALRYE